MIYMVLAYYSYGYGYGYGYDPTWILLIITGIIAVVAQLRVSSSFSKYSRGESRTGLTGAEAAERILHSKGIYDVKIQYIAGNRGYQSLDSEYSDIVKLTYLVPEEEAQRFCAEITEATNGKTEMEDLGEQKYAILDKEFILF